MYSVQTFMYKAIPFAGGVLHAIAATQLPCSSNLPVHASLLANQLPL